MRNNGSPLLNARDHFKALTPLRRPTLDPAKDDIHVIP
jgi:hypothetical protein